MRIFYADYENIQSAGLEGIDRLTEDDRLYVFYSVHAETIKIGVVNQILNSLAKVEFVEADAGTENALDFQLVAGLFANISEENEYYIVSRDTGFDAAIKMGVRLGYSNIHRISTLQKLLDAETKTAEDELVESGHEVTESAVQMDIELIPAETCGSEDGVIVNLLGENQIQNIINDIIAEKCGRRTSEKYGELILIGLRKSTNKNQFYQFFRKNLGDAEGGNLYRNIRGKFDEMKAFITH